MTAFHEPDLLLEKFNHWLLLSRNRVGFGEQVKPRDQLLVRYMETLGLFKTFPLRKGKNEGCVHLSRHLSVQNYR